MILKTDCMSHLRREIVSGFGVSSICGLVYVRVANLLFHIRVGPDHI